MNTAYGTGNVHSSMQAPQVAAAAITATMAQMSWAHQQATAGQFAFNGAFQSAPQLQTPASAEMPPPQWNLPAFQSPEGPLPPVMPSLTAGLPDPAALEKQKESYIQNLVDQKNHFIGSLDEQKKQHLDSIYGEAEKMKAQLILQIEQQVKQQVLGLEKQYNEQVMQLNQQYHEQRAGLEQQVIKLKGEYQQKQLEEQAMHRQFQLQKERCEAEQRYASDIQKLQIHQQDIAQQQQQLAQKTSIFSAPTADQGINQAAANRGGFAPPVTMYAPQGSKASDGTAQPPGTIYLPQGNGSYVPPPVQGSTGSYVPPPQQGSYVPPHNISAVPPLPGSYVPPPNGRGSYAPPPAHNGSYVPPATVPSGAVGSYVPPEGPRRQQQVVSQPLPPSYASAGMQAAPTIPVVGYN
jgi:hypothetical protein